MIKAGSPAVQNFIGAFHRLRDRVADDPGMLDYEAQADPSLAKLCRELGLAAFFLKHAQQRRPQFFSTSNAPSFVAVWRDYEARYAHAVDGVVLSSTGLLTPQPRGFEEAAAEGSDEFDRIWEREQDEAASNADVVRSAMAFAEDEIELQAERGECNERLMERMRDGVRAWKSLVEEADLAGVLRRRRLAPLPVIPRHRSENDGASDLDSLMGRLSEAQAAFVYGAPHAAFALMRVMLDLVLTTRYAATGDTLRQKIESAKERLPRGIGWSEVESLENFADDAIRFPPKESRGLKDEESEIVALLKALRKLIELAPA